MRLSLGAGLVLGLVVAQAAAAANLRDTLDDFGFFGPWAVHCDREASPDNIFRNTTVTGSGEVEFTETFGKTFEANVYRVLDVRSRKGNTLVMSVELDGKHQALTMRRHHNKVRTMRNETGSGALLVENGTVVATARPTPWLSRCSEADQSKPGLKPQ